MVAFFGSKGHLKSFLHIFRTNVSNRWADIFLYLNSEKYSVTDVLSAYIYIFLIIFDILFDKLMTVHHSQIIKNIYIFCYFNRQMAPNEYKCILMKTRRFLSIRAFQRCIMLHVYLEKSRYGVSQKSLTSL